MPARVRGLLWIAVIVAALVIVWRSDAVGGAVDVALQRGEVLLGEHALLGGLLFIALAAASAMLAFFSSAVLVPSAMLAWGAPTTFALLWIGWIVGGVTAYAIGRWLGRAVVHRFVSAERLDYYEQRVSKDARWWMLLLIQLALPSELPGYLAGVLRVRFPLYLAALALGELPYAIGSVFLGDAFVQRNALVFAAVAIVGFALFGGLAMLLRRQLSRARREQRELGGGGADLHLHDAVGWRG